MKAQAAKATPNRSASEQISSRITELGDWRGQTLSRMRKLIQQAVPDVLEEWKWAKATSPGTPVWSHNGILCTGETYKQVVKLTFMKGASLKDPTRLFNSSLEGNARRAIDIRQGEKVDETAFKNLIREAVAANGGGAPKSAKPRRAPKASGKAVPPAAKTKKAKSAKPAKKAKASKKK